MKFERVWAMPNKWTFQIPQIALLIKEEMADTMPWIDPFAGMTSPAHTRNDINPAMPAEYHLDALEFLNLQLEENGIGHFKGANFDPPFSVRQVKECYQRLGFPTPPQQTKSDYLTKCKDLLALLIAVEGKAISCGWNSGGLGKNRGFVLDRILLVYHGGPHNDTIVTVETKVQEHLIVGPDTAEESLLRREPVQHGSISAESERVRVADSHE